MCRLFIKPQTCRLSRFFEKIVAVRSFTADSSLLQPTVGVNTTTSHVHFRSVNLFKEFSYRLKVNKVDALTTSELVSRHAERQAQQCVK